MLTNIRHTFSDVDLMLTTTAIIDGRDVTLTTGWSSKAAAEEHGATARQQHVTKLAALDADGVDKVPGARKARVQHLFTLAGRDVMVGSMRGQVFDEAMVTIAGHAWSAPIDGATGRTMWGAWHKRERDGRGHGMCGLGFRTWAAYIAVQPKS